MRWMVCLYCGMLLHQTSWCRGFAVEGAHVRVDANMATNLSGCFACGDLAGKPYQYIKAAGQGQCCSPVGCGMAGKTKKK